MAISSTAIVVPAISNVAAIAVVRISKLVSLTAEAEIK